MPRGVYDRGAARARNEANAMPDHVIAASPTPVRTSARTVQRDEDWGQRSRKVKGAIDYYAMAAGLQPSDAVYQWKTYTIYGQEQKEKQTIYQENGWSAVPADRAGHQMLPSQGHLIIHEGMILMEQPLHLYREARAEDDRAHKEQLAMGYSKIKETPDGQMDRRVGQVTARNETLYVDAGAE